MNTIVPTLASLFIRALHSTLRIRFLHRERMAEMDRNAKPYVLTVWHAQLLMMAYAGFLRPLVVMISQHRDGELIANTLAGFGIEASRGSTTRGGSEALREMVRIGRSGVRLAFTPDGPRGPRRIAQSGVVTAAQLTGMPVLPVAFIPKKKSC